MSKTIFITGASRGFGKIWTEAFLKRGDNVIATARNIDALKDLQNMYESNLLAIQLDINDRTADIAAINLAKEHFGSIDVLINNAGYGLFGAVEETSEEQARKQMETNFFGMLWLTQAVLPVMRNQGYGHIIQVSSMLGLITMPALGLYNASKFATEGLNETLAAEVKGFGINITMLEPNAYATDWAGKSAESTIEMDVYQPMKAGVQQFMAAVPFGDPTATSAAVLKLVDSEKPPLRLLLGKIAYPYIKQAYTERLADWEAWNDVSVASHGN